MKIVHYNEYLFRTVDTDSIPDSKIHGVNMGPTWVLSALDGPHVGPMNLAVRDGASAPGIKGNSFEYTPMFFQLFIV